MKDKCFIQINNYGIKMIYSRKWRIPSLTEEKETRMVEKQRKEVIKRDEEWNNVILWHFLFYLGICGVLAKAKIIHNMQIKERQIKLFQQNVFSIFSENSFA